MTLKEMAVETIVGKQENAGNQHFLLFPQCLVPCKCQKSFFELVICKGFQFCPIEKLLSCKESTFYKTSKVKAFSDDKSNSKHEFSLSEGRNLVGKGEIATTSIFFFFSFFHCFLKLS